MDSVQFFSNAGISIINIFLIFCIALSVRQSRKQLSILIIIVAYFIFTPFKSGFQISRDFYISKKTLHEIKIVLNGIDNVVGAYLKSPNEYISVSHKQPIAYPIGEYLILINPMYASVDLSILNVSPETNPIDKEREKIMLNYSVFYHCVKRQKEQNTFKSIEESQLDFIKEYKIRYLITSKNVTLPSNLQDKIQKEIIIEEAQEKFYLLKE